VPRRIRSGLCGYSAAQLRRILFNRIGKNNVDELNKAEAVQMLPYSATPGAHW
jgi:hypothetical protein